MREISPFLERDFLLQNTGSKEFLGLEILGQVRHMSD